MEKDISHNQNQDIHQKKDIQVYEAISNFIKDKEGMHMYRRAEKICKAYFLLTQHIPDHDSIRLKLRTLALDMSSKTLDLVVTINKTEAHARDIAMNAMALVSVSDIAVSARLVSDSNYNLVVGQVQLFVEEVELYWKTLSYNNQAIPTHLFSMDTLDVAYKNSRTDQSNQFGELTNESNNPNTVRAVSGDTDMSFKKSQAQVSAKLSVKTIDKSNGSASSALSSKSLMNATTSHPSANSTQNGAQNINGAPGVKNDRQTLILSTIRSKGESSIKDLTDIIRGCSEKTIQRELIALVGSGDLLKTGERRWSRYSIAI